MQSPFLGDMSTEVETWSSSLQQVEEITDLWYTCQKKVQKYLFSAFRSIAENICLKRFDRKQMVNEALRQY